MSATITMPQVAPVLRVRAALRRRSERPSMAKVESIEDGLMLGWTEEQIRRLREGGERIAAMEEELQDLTTLARATVGVPADQLSRMVVFTKLESAKGLLRQLRQLVALTALVVLGYVAVDISDDSMAFARSRGARVVRVLKARKELEGAA